MKKVKVIILLLSMILISCKAIDNNDYNYNDFVSDNEYLKEMFPSENGDDFDIMFLHSMKLGLTYEDSSVYDYDSLLISIKKYLDIIPEHKITAEGHLNSYTSTSPDKLALTYHVVQTDDFSIAFIYVIIPEQLELELQSEKLNEDLEIGNIVIIITKPNND
ncbi:MAG: hypothetical protein JXR88_00550 [Clostridia bacterium]|nr:hypothetical protein [Clostridia bacterium]